MACGFCATRLAVTEVEPCAFRARAALLSQLRAARARGEQTAEGSQVWLDRLMDTFDVGDAAPVERSLGAWNAAADAKGAHVVAFLSGDDSFVSSGGEAAYRLQAGLTPEGYAAGWWTRCRLFFERHGLDEEGYLARLPGYTRLSEAECGVLPPALQLLARARFALWGVPVIEHGLGAKRKDTHVALDVAAASFWRVAAIQYRYNITAAYSGDASRDVRRDEKGAVSFDELGAVQLVTFATVRHSGRVQ